MVAGPALSGNQFGRGCMATCARDSSGQTACASLQPRRLRLRPSRPQRLAPIRPRHLHRSKRLAAHPAPTHLPLRRVGVLQKRQHRFLSADLARRNNWPWDVGVVFNPDSAIATSPAIAITSDSLILDRVERWADFKSYLLAREIPNAWLVDLTTPAA